MSNSSMVKYTKLTKNFSNGRQDQPIRRITIHCTAGNKNSTAKDTVDYFYNCGLNGRECSSNYCVGGVTAGDVGMSVEEANRSWCSSSRENDNKAITIEVASSSDGKEVNEVAIETTIQLCIDIMKRNGMNKAVWFGENSKDKSLSYELKEAECLFTIHKWWAANKACPGEYILKRFQYIIDSINSAFKTVEPLQPQKTEWKEMSHEEFIEAIDNALKLKAEQYGIKNHSAIIAQAINESGWGTSNKAKHHNYFGLKYREGRLTCHSGTFVDGSSEQNADGSYVAITDQWYEFNNITDGVEGYLQFINIDRYKNLKGVTDTNTYIENIKADGYATSLSYVENLKKIVATYNLDKYNPYNKEDTELATYNQIVEAMKKLTVIEKKNLISEINASLTDNTKASEKAYRIQVVANKSQTYDAPYISKAKSNGLEPVYDRKDGDYWRVFIGAFDAKTDADAYLVKVKKVFKDAFVKYI